MIVLYFYTTAGCHLCEQAEVLLNELESHVQLDITIVDIATDEKLIEQYGVRIPVVKRLDVPDDLGWPFDYGQLKAYLSLN